MAQYWYDPLTGTYYNEQGQVVDPAGYKPGDNVTAGRPPTVGPGDNAGGMPVYRWPDGSVHATPFDPNAPPDPNTDPVAYAAWKARQPQPTAPTAEQTRQVTGWGGGDDEVWRPFEDDVQKEYATKQDPTGTMRQYVAAFTDPNGRQGRYAQSQFARLFADYSRRAEQNPDLFFPDTLTPHAWRDLMGSFNGQSASQREEYSNLWGGPGRRLG